MHTKQVLDNSGGTMQQNQVGQIIEHINTRLLITRDTFDDYKIFDFDSEWFFVPRCQQTKTFELVVLYTVFPCNSFCGNYFFFEPTI